MEYESSKMNPKPPKATKTSYDTEIGSLPPIGGFVILIIVLLFFMILNK